MATFLLTLLALAMSTGACLTIGILFVVGADLPQNVPSGIWFIVIGLVSLAALICHLGKGVK